MNQKGEGVFETVVVIIVIAVLTGGILHFFAINEKNKFQAASAKGYIVVNDLSKYSVKLIETRKTTDENWTPVKNEK